MPTNSGMNKHAGNQPTSPTSLARKSVAAGSKDIKIQINNHRSWISAAACASRSRSNCNQFQPVFKNDKILLLKPLQRCSWQKPWTLAWKRWAAIVAARKCHVWGMVAATSTCWSFRFCNQSFRSFESAATSKATMLRAWEALPARVLRIDSLNVNPCLLFSPTFGTYLLNKRFQVILRFCCEGTTMNLQHELLQPASCSYICLGFRRLAEPQDLGRLSSMESSEDRKKEKTHRSCCKDTIINHYVQRKIEHKKR